MRARTSVLLSSPVEMLGEIGNVERVDSLEELDVVLLVVLGDVLAGGQWRPVHRHVVVEIVVEH